MAGAESTREEETAAAVKAEQIRTLFRGSPWILAINPVNAAVVGAVLWSRARGPLIVAWVAAMALVAALRLVLRRGFGAAPLGPEALRGWARRYVALVAAAGLLWGAGSLLLYSSAEHATELILVFVVAGMTAGAAGTFAVYLPAFYAFAAPTLLPLAGRIFLEGGALHAAMGALGVVYGAALALVAASTNRAVGDAFRLRFQNEALLAGLARAQTSLEEANRTLEERVAERSAALKRQDEALHEARRVESLGLLAGGVAHDFNNLLTVILGNAALLEETPGLAGDREGPLGEIRGAADRAATLVSQLLASSRRQVREPRVLDLNAVVSEAHRLLARLIGEHIALSLTRRPGPLPVYADRGQLEQVIVNLATNARDAMPAGGALTIETDEEALAGGDERAGAVAASPLPPGRYVVLSVRDTGVGMDAETLRLAFEPFFTTKEVGRGTGLGLATVNGIVEQSGGRVFVESEPGRGSTFRVLLPRAPEAVTEEPAPAAVAAPRPGATALVVEDDAGVRGVIARALAAAGLTVLEADHGEQALARAGAHDGPIDLLVTDVVMARMGGPELARRLAAERPGLRVLFTSGYGREAAPAAPEAAAGVDFLQKPFASEALVERVARLLAGPPSPAPGGPPRVAGAPGRRRS
jgi:signal transduction histidine kinase/CheY-like chemotaxis protein